MTGTCVKSSCTIGRGGCEFAITCFLARLKYSTMSFPNVENVQKCKTDAQYKYENGFFFFGKVLSDWTNLLQ